MTVTFSETAWEEYVAWQTEDKRTLKSINKLIKDIQRDGLLSGQGKPEHLKYIDAYSRRIDEKNRLLYVANKNGGVEISPVKGITKINRKRINIPPNIPFLKNASLLWNSSQPKRGRLS